MGWVCCWLSPRAEMGLFSGFSAFPPSTKTNISKFQFEQDRGNVCCQLSIGHVRYIQAWLRDFRVKIANFSFCLIMVPNFSRDPHYILKTAICKTEESLKWSERIVMDFVNVDYLVLLKCLWNEILAPFFYSRKLNCMLHRFIIFEVKLWSGVQNNFLSLQSWQKMQLSFSEAWN